MKSNIIREVEHKCDELGVSIDILVSEVDDPACINGLRNGIAKIKSHLSKLLYDQNSIDDEELVAPHEFSDY